MCIGCRFVLNDGTRVSRWHVCLNGASLLHPILVVHADIKVSCIDCVQSYYLSSHPFPSILSAASQYNCRACACIRLVKWKRSKDRNPPSGWQGVRDPASMWLSSLAAFFPTCSLVHRHAAAVGILCKLYARPHIMPLRFMVARLRRRQGRTQSDSA